MPRLEHLDLNGITAERLCTPVQSILGVSDGANTAKVREEVEEAKQASIDSIVVFNQDRRFENYVLVKDLITVGYRLEKSLFRKCNELSYGSDLLCVLDKFSRDCDRYRGHYPLYSILGPNRRIIGIMNFTDLNRRPVYIVAYATLVNLETYLKTEIRKAYGKANLSWLDILERKERKKIDKIRKENGVDYFESTSLKQLVSLVKSEKCKFKITKQSVLDSLEAVSNLRNRIAHPVNMLIRKSSYRRDIKDLQHSVKILTVADEAYFSRNR